MSPIQRLRHDSKVRETAMSLLADGYDVTARIEGWFKSPSEINGYRPDIVAQKGNKYFIYEVRKGPIDWPKEVALRRYADSNERWELKVVNL